MTGGKPCDDGDSDVESKDVKPETKQHNTGAKDLEKVTDYVEEDEIKSSGLSDVSTFLHLLSRVT